MTDKELIQQAFNALDKFTDLFPDARGGHGQEAEDACNAAFVVMADLAARLQQPEKTTNERIEAYLKIHLQPQYNNSYGEVVEYAHYFMCQEDIDDLVALIIDECINQAEKAKNTKEAIRAEPDVADQLAMKSENDGIKYAIEKIKHHFGIEK